MRLICELDVFSFYSRFLGVRLIRECVLYAQIYGSSTFNQFNTLILRPVQCQICLIGTTTSSTSYVSWYFSLVINHRFPQRGTFLGNHNCMISLTQTYT